MSQELDESSPNTWEELVDTAQQQDPIALAEKIESLSPSDQAFAFAHMTDEQTEQVLGTLSPDDAADLIAGLPEAQAAHAIATLEADAAAAIVRELTSDEQADLIGDLSPEDAEAILGELPSDAANDVRNLTRYADDVAGGLMVSELFKFPVTATIRDVVDQLAVDSERLGDRNIRYGYVIDEGGRLVGVLPMQQLLFVKRSTPIVDVMIGNPLSVPVTMDLFELMDVFDRHRFLGVPVVDAEGLLRGVVHREAVEHAVTLASESDYLKSQGIVGGEELRNMPLWLRARRRLSWLSINIFLNLGAASVIAMYQDTLQAVIALAVFLPIISDMSGCSGNQAVAVSMRELAMGLVRPNELFRVWSKEVTVGLVNGAALGLLIGIVATIFDGNPFLGLVVGAALFLNTVLAVSIGGLVPLLLKRLGFDPAVASGPLLTTITDMCGFFLVLGFASVTLNRLVS
ncbi:magnesium transporter [Roseiconus nitratireducens]|uniref:Magnesium transporter MgtE n=1 Tax=Roseiconus nitratireducens TaxID=2605748 RepID=A0A5M6CXQ8_9BACT|nr:magnesium transporter [Roseiconus nitratireducens]KAA5539726.1 magnesium transporter [Roseiconus nitratireducens]